jgi:hypothetical protein
MASSRQPRLDAASRVTLHIFWFELALIMPLSNLGPKGWAVTAALLLGVCALIHSALAVAKAASVNQHGFADWDCASWLGLLALCCTML